MLIILQIPGPGTDAAGIAAPLAETTNGLNLGPVSDQSGGKVVARVGGLCELLTRSGGKPSRILAAHATDLTLANLPYCQRWLVQFRFQSYPVHSSGGRV